MIEALQHEFMQNALLAGVLVSVVCGIIGTYVVLNRMVFVSGGIAHAAFGGVGLAYLIGTDPFLAAIPFSIGAAVVIGLIHRRGGQRSDTAIGVVWAVGMALGIVFIDLHRGYASDLMSYLFGSILTVSRGDLLMIGCVDVIVLAVVGALQKELLLVSFDEEFAVTRGVPAGVIFYVMLVLTAVTVVIMMRLVGLILVIALLTVPAAISSQVSRSMRGMMALSGLAGMVFCTGGIALSYWLNLSPGGVIILLAGVAYGVSVVVRHRP